MASSRLKRKLERGDDVDSHGNLNESFVSYGTALPSLADNKRDKNEFVPIHQQIVTDEQGRRRLHGAFQGGFSAGYFNTVGSKEGWAPQAFTSSRSNRAKHVQNAEDFMDDEDKAEMLAAKQLKTNAAYDVLSNDAGPSAGPSEATLFKMISAGNNRIGEKLLTKMGWRSGQGVGPRVTLKARQRQAAELGVILDRDQEEYLTHNGSIKGKEVLFAPLDRPLAVYPAKDNQFGLGFIPGTNLQHNIYSDERHTKSVPNKTQKEGGRSMPVGGAFGIGAMEDADNDDMSVYDTSERPHASTGLGGYRIDRGHRTDGDSSFRGGRPSSSKFKGPISHISEKYNDGTPVISGFALATESIQPDTWFAPPDIPPDWRPDPQKIFAQAARALQDVSNGISNSQQPTGRPPEEKQVDRLGRPVLSANDRGQMLGEQVQKAPPPSVFEFISKKNQERIAALISAGKKPQISSSSSLPVSISLTVPTVDPKIAAAALKGFMPFGDDKAKQARYRFYLEAQAGLKEGTFAPKATDPSKVEELNNELQSFAQSARVFKPMSTAMASRFTSGSSVSTALDMKAPTPGLRTFTPSQASADDKAEPGKREDAPPKEEDISSLPPKAQAVRLDMFGPMTRTVTDFYPNRLLCKRFNVRVPHPGGSKDDDNQEDAKEEKDLLNKGTMEKLSKEGGYDLPVDFHQKSTSSKIHNDKENARPLASVGLGEDDTQGRDTLTYEKPAMDLFKAIFAESEEDDSEDETAQPIVAQTKPSVLGPAKAPLEAPQAPRAHDPMEPISLADFKPTFVPKLARSAEDRSLKSSVKEKAKTKPSVIAMKKDYDDEADSIAPVLAKEKRKKSKTKDKEKDKKAKRAKLAFDEAEDDEWVEKETALTAAQPARTGRLKASDLM